MIRRIGLSLLLLAVLCGCSSATPAADTVVFLVRHAETVKTGDDPALSPPGIDRSDRLAVLLADAHVTHIHSTDYVRTKTTAAPLASRLGIDVSLYDPRKLEAFATRLRETPGRHLVVGHSNTTPGMVKLLGGEPGSPIDEPGEYDRLYIVTIDSDGVAETMLLRYGTAYEAKVP